VEIRQERSSRDPDSDPFQPDETARGTLDHKGPPHPDMTKPEPKSPSLARRLERRPAIRALSANTGPFERL